MKSIAIDFTNNTICIMTEGQEGTQLGGEVIQDRARFQEFFPKEYQDRSSYTWNFEDETVSVNQEYRLVPGSIMTKDCFIPEVILPMHGLAKRWKEFCKLLNLEEVETKEIIPEALRKLFGI